MIVSLRVKSSDIVGCASGTSMLNNFEVIMDVSRYLAAQLMTNHYQLPKMAYMLAQAMLSDK